ncbi:MAG: hypothetical protein ACO1N5_12465 [Noviherbaspirillum sp.]
MAAFSSKNGLSLLKRFEDAGIVVGVFFDPVVPDRSHGVAMAEALHERGDAAVQLVPNSLAQAYSSLCR